MTALLSGLATCSEVERHGLQIGKKTEGELIDLTPERKEGFATATFDLEAIRWQRARSAIHTP